MSRRIPLLLALSLWTSVFVLISPSAACASNHIRILLTGFPSEGSSRFIYYAVESQGSASFTILAGGDACSENASVGYSASGGTATAGADYQQTSGTESFFLPPHESDSKSVSVTILNDSNDLEAHVESIQVGLSNPQNASLGAPATAPILIIDDDGPTRWGLEGSEHTQSETFPSLRIPVFLAGDAPGTSVGYTITPDSATPATAGQDYQGSSGTLTFGPGERVKTIDLTLVNDPVAESPESFIVSVAGAVPGAGQMKVTILDNEEGDRPTSRLHHPRHSWRYKKSDYRIREIHIFASDPTAGGRLASGVVAAQLALRRNMKNGKCQWWTGEGWERRDCQNREWLETQYDPVGELYRYRMKQLKSSVGTRVKNYTAFSRAIDGAGNIEGDFNEKRNANTFEVKRSRRRR
jgi:hypothetical protein